MCLHTCNQYIYFHETFSNPGILFPNTNIFVNFLKSSCVGVLFYSSKISFNPIAMKFMESILEDLMAKTNVSFSKGKWHSELHQEAESS